MHIKQVLISGFRSFRNQTDTEEFSPRHNVVVGRNGSGKSNFFDAIQFVLVAPKFSTLRQEDRQNLLHEGAGSSVMAAYVEIIFDNSDGRLALDTDSVIIRRTVGHKKDEFFLNRKHVTKSEIVSLLETAGFSKSNPYYIVQQGKVAHLCVMTDRNRLNLLKEVAGTTVYEERRSESVKIMEKSVAERNKVNEVLEYLEERLGELDAEKSELVEFEKLDRQRRALEFNIYEKDFREAQNKLEEVEQERELAREQQTKLHVEIRDIQDELAQEEDLLTTLRAANGRLLIRREQKNEEMVKIETRKNEVDIQIEEIGGTATKKRSSIESSSQQLREIQTSIAQRQRQIDEMTPRLKQLQDRELEEGNEIHQLRKQLEVLYAKQGRGTQFRTKAERDQFLQTQIDTLREQLSRNEELLTSQETDLQTEEHRIHNESIALQALDQENMERQRQYEELGRTIREQNVAINQMIETRKHNWRDVETFKEQIKDTENDLERGKQQLSKTLPRSISDGLKTIEYVVQQRNLRGYYGPLIDNISLKSDAFRLPVEVAAGNSLFHVVVDTDETAAILVKELERTKVGRLTFLPLNRLRVPTLRYPDPTDREAYRLIEHALDFDRELEPAVRQIFGGKLIARNLEVAARYARDYQMDCITMEGDVVYGRGNVEGGYHDDRVSRIAAVVKIREATEKLRTLRENLAILSTEAADAEKQINDQKSTNQKLTVERQQVQALNEQFLRDHSTRAKKLSLAVQTLAENRRNLIIINAEINDIKERIVSYEQEKKTALTQKFTDQDRAELRDSEERLRLLLEQHETTKREVSRIVIERDQVQIEMQSGLQKRKEELELKLKLNKPDDEVTVTRDLDAELDALQAESTHLGVTLTSLAAEVTEMNELIQQKGNDMNILEQSVEEKREAERNLLQQRATIAAEVDRLVNQRSMLMDAMESRQRKIRDLGAIPSKEQGEYQALKIAQLTRQLRDVQEGLKRFSSVNRKALDQYLSFSEQRNSLLQRKEELDRDAQSIEQLIGSLDSQKNEAIMRTFTSVSRHFSGVFAELVPSGKGQLIMKTLLDKNAPPDSSLGENGGSLEEHVLDEEEERGEDGSRLSINQFRGVEVSVSFTGVGQHYTMTQLSGGQKSLVALALIFAIQRCDPAPFYLFDEIDQALDANYRTSVARLIQSQANSEDAPAQFITTTFRPEMVNVADKFFGIKLENKVSNLVPLSKDDASDFVTNLMQDEEAVVQASRAPTFSRTTPMSGLTASRSAAASGGASTSRRPTLGTSRAAAVEEEEEGEDEEDDEQLRQQIFGDDSARKKITGRGGRGSAGPAKRQRGAPRASKKRGRSKAELEEEEEEVGESGGEEGVDLDEEEEIALHALGLT